MFDIFKLEYQGDRRQMEDVTTVVENFGGHSDWLFGGIYDGHGGDAVAKLAAEKIPGIFLENLKDGAEDDVRRAFESAYKEVSHLAAYDFVGATALSFFLKGELLYVANAGDSRLVIISKNGMEPITHDHRAQNDWERERIAMYGGRIDDLGYVRHNGFGLMCTRSLGDQIFKKSGITWEPEHFTYKLPNEYASVFAATDGLWDALASGEVTEKISPTMTAREITEVFLKKIKEVQQETAVDNVAMIAVSMK